MLTYHSRWLLSLLTVVLGTCSVVFWTYNVLYDQADLSIRGEMVIMVAIHIATYLLERTSLTP